MYCSKCGTQLPDNTVACINCGARIVRRSYFKITSITLSILVVLIVAGFFANRQIKISALNSKLEEVVGKDAGYTETIIKVEAESSSMSYKELFDLCEKSIEERTNLIIELRGLYPDIDSKLRMKLIDFLNAENELIRKKNSFYRKQLSFTSTFDLYKDHLSDPPTSSYGWDYFKQRAVKLQKEILEASSEMKEAATGFISTYKTLVNQEADVKKAMDDSGLRFVVFFQKYEQENLKRAEDAKKLAENMKI
jgi:hypothetical protein